MARYKPVRGRKAVSRQRPNAIGCIVLLVMVFVLVFFVMYLSVKQG